MSTFLFQFCNFILILVCFLSHTIMTLFFFILCFSLMGVLILPCKIPCISKYFLFWDLSLPNIFKTVIFLLVWPVFWWFRRRRSLAFPLTSCRYGFVEFDDPRDADDAVYDLNGKELCGERVIVEHTKGPRRDGGYGGGGRSKFLLEILACFT